MKIFFDTNVLVSAFATRGLCADLFGYVQLEHELLVGEVVLIELRRALRDKIKLPTELIDQIEELLRDTTVVAKPKQHLSLGVSDADDEWIVASAVVAQADAVVTGDAALLTLGNKSPVRILSPRQLWEALRHPGK